MRPIVPALALALALAACTDDGRQADPTPTPDRPPSVTLLGRNLEVFPGAERAVRVGFAPADRSARVIVRFEPRDAVIDVCGLASIDGDVSDRARCRRDVRSGVRETITAAEMRAVAVVLRGEGAAIFELVVEYAEGDRDLSVRMPVLRAPPGGVDCSDNACNPFFELQPTRAGAFSATATWDGPDATLVLLQGSVLGRAQTATGLPYAEPAREDGSSPLRISTSLTAPAEYALAFRHTRQGASVPAIRDALLEVSWP